MVATVLLAIARQVPSRMRAVAVAMVFLVSSMVAYTMSPSFRMFGGLGDTTFAGYLTERLDHDIPAALEFAAALVSLKMETPGPFMGTRQDVLDYIKRFYR